MPDRPGSAGGVGTGGERALPRAPAYGVEGVALGGHLEPGGRVVRRPVAAPAGERLDDRGLHRLLGEVEVAEPPRQPGHQRAGLLAQGLREESVRGVHVVRSASGRGHSNCE